MLSVDDRIGRLMMDLDCCKVFGDTAAGILYNHAMSLQSSR
jgi:hypothetical protein